VVENSVCGVNDVIPKDSEQALTRRGCPLIRMGQGSFACLATGRKYDIVVGVMDLQKPICLSSLQETDNFLTKDSQSGENRRVCCVPQNMWRTSSNYFAAVSAFWGFDRGAPYLFVSGCTFGKRLYE